MPERAARLLGAAEAQRETLGTPREGFLRAEHARVTEATRLALGQDSFARAYGWGRTATWEQAVDYAAAAAGATGQESDA
jgi:hypothetical protein